MFFVGLLVGALGLGCVWVDSFCFNSLIWLRSWAISFSSFKVSAFGTGWEIFEVSAGFSGMNAVAMERDRDSARVIQRVVVLLMPSQSGQTVAMERLVRRM